MELITVEVGTTKLQTPSPALARRVLEAATGLDQVPLFDLPNITSLTPPAIGQYWQGQGGFYAGLMRGQDGQPDYHLVVSAADAGEVKAITWGGKGESESGAESDWDGQANTSALLNSGISHPAAEWVGNTVIEEHRDFYLPSRRELRLCWVNVPEQFAKEWYWSSTQSSPDLAWTQYFVGGGQLSVRKDNELRARAVRRVLTPSALEHFTPRA
ncbi:DUF1566 domain-containing protein [Pseudomonas sp. EggHat1]|uniref:DUF1566 domain-containing protein n=1 Tax=Pseudomonas sp. EggHat1 TaxID=2761624 RepID=UPI0018690F5C|nr:DUF1566 domain-containing protein [Pseudomonas sp. EggHat1]